MRDTPNPGDVISAGSDGYPRFYVRHVFQTFLGKPGYGIAYSRIRDDGSVVAWQGGGCRSIYQPEWEEGWQRVIGTYIELYGDREVF